MIIQGAGVMIDIPDHVLVRAHHKGGAELEFFTLLNGCRLVSDPDAYPKSVFFCLKGDVALMDFRKDKEIWCHHFAFWSKIGKHFSRNYSDTQRFTKNMVEEHFKLRSVTPKSSWLCFDG